MAAIPARTAPGWQDENEAGYYGHSCRASCRAILTHGGANKLLAIFDGKPLVRRSVEVAMQADSGSVIVVTGHMADDIAVALQGLDVAIVHNPLYATGIASSITTALLAMPSESDGLMIHLGDMPRSIRITSAQ